MFYLKNIYRSISNKPIFYLLMIMCMTLTTVISCSFMRVINANIPDMHYNYFTISETYDNASFYNSLKDEDNIEYIAETYVCDAPDMYTSLNIEYIPIKDNSKNNREVYFTENELDNVIQPVMAISLSLASIYNISIGDSVDFCGRSFKIVKFSTGNDYSIFISGAVDVDIDNRFLPLSQGKDSGRIESYGKPTSRLINAVNECGSTYLPKSQIGVNSIMIIVVAIVVMILLSLVTLFCYINLSKQNSILYANYKIVGCKNRKIAASMFIECMLMIIISFGIGIALELLLVYPLLTDFFSVFSVVDYGILFAVNFVVTIIALAVNIIITARKPAADKSMLLR